MEIRIREIKEPEEKRDIVRRVLEALTDWFGVPEAREEYIEQSGGLPFWAAFSEDGKVAGFICLSETGKDTAELHVLGVLQEYHRLGIGTQLFQAAREAAAGMGYSFLQVKTVKEGVYPEYDVTNRYYRSLGFREFEVFPEYWDRNNPCQIYVMYIGR